MNPGAEVIKVWGAEGSLTRQSLSNFLSPKAKLYWAYRTFSWNYNWLTRDNVTLCL